MYFWPKNGQNGKNKNCPGHNTDIKWFTATVQSFWPSFRQIWCADSKKMAKNLIFWLKMAKNDQNWPFLAKISKTRIFFKNPLGPFFKTHQDVALCKKSSKSDARFSRYGVWRTNGRTNGRTDERTDGRAWIHRPQRLKPRDQKLSKLSILAKKWP